MKQLSILAATAAALMMGVSAPALAQTTSQPATIDGKPNLNGIWQAVNEANWDIEGHELVHGNAFENLDVLEDLLRHLRSRSLTGCSSLPARQNHAHHVHARGSDDAGNHSP